MKPQSPVVVTIEGTAVNDKSGAQIESADRCVDLMGMRRWPEATLGKKVRLRGTLIRRESSTPKVEDPEETAQGRNGTVWELRDFTTLEIER